jgi:competence protein ComEA
MWRKSASMLLLWAGLASAEPVDLNAATAKEIAAALTGIGLKRAEQIVEYRDRFGPIQTPEELLAIKGIGEKTLEKNRDRMITGLAVPAPIIGLDAGGSNH